MGAKANHGYVPQCYLRGFASGEKEQVFVSDLHRKSSYATSIWNVASKRYFNRVECDGVDPDFLEEPHADAEGIIAPLHPRSERGRTFYRRRAQVRGSVSACADVGLES